MNTPTSSERPGLVRALGPLVATAITIGTVIGSGVFKKPQVVAENIPYSGLVALVWVLVGLLALMGSLAYAEVAVLFPKAGGNYVFLREGYGRLAGFLWGWVEFWIIRSASIAALATMFTESFVAFLREALGPDAGGAFLGYWPQRGITVAVLVLLALVNVRGVRWGGGLQFGITLVKVGSLLAILFLPFVMLGLTSDPARRPHLSNLEPAWPSQGFQLSAFITAMLGVLWAYHGWMNVAWVAEEVKNPQRNLPVALLGGVGTVIFLYLGANLAYSLVLTQNEMRTMKEGGPAIASADPSQPPVHDRTVAIGFSRRLLGSAGVTLIAAAVMCSVFGALNGNLLVGPRMLYAMGEDGLAPELLARIHPEYRTPAMAIWVMAGWACLLVVGTAALTALGLLSSGKDHFDILTDFAMFGAVIFETMAVLSIFVFRRKLPNAERPYSCWGYPWVPALYAILPAMILGNFFVKQQFEAAMGTGFIIVGTIVYFVFAPKTRPVA